MRALFVVNPAAGRGRGRAEWERIAPRLRSVGDFAVQFTSGPGDATRLAQDAAAAGYDRVVSVGGDGTMYEVMNGLCGTGAALGILPGGTGNDYANCLGLPKDMYEAAVTALQGTLRRVDVGRLSTGGHFLNVAGAGFDAEVAIRVNRYPKYLGGTVPYVAGILTTMWHYSPREMEILLDDRTIKRKVLLIAVALGSSYGAGMRIAPDARVDDGYFDVCIGGDLSHMELLQLMPQLFKGTHVRHPKVEMLRCRRVELRSDRSVAIQADGELIGDLPVSMELLPGYLPVVVPG